MKKVLISMMIALTLIGCGNKQEEVEEAIVITNPVAINGEKTDMNAYRWINDKDNAFLEVSMEESIRFFTEKGSGILVYGYPGCIYCERALPELNKAAKQHNITVYYCNVYRPDASADIYERLRPNIEPIFDVQGGVPVFKVPEVIAIKNGEIVGHHLALVDGYTIDSEESKMNDDQKQELQNIYIDLFKAAAD